MKYWLVVAALIISSAPVKADELPFKLVESWVYENIPDNQGIKFFYGVWEDRVDMTITPTRIKGENPDVYWDFSVLVEAPNYIHLLTRKQELETPIEFTSFSVFTYKTRYMEDWSPDAAYPYMRRHSCGWFKQNRDKKTFGLSTKRLLVIFKNSICGTDIKTDYRLSSTGTLGDGWSFSNYTYSKKTLPRENDFLIN